MAYLNAKNAPTIKPGPEMISIGPPPIERASNTARPADAKEAIIIIRIMGFVAANSPDLTGDSISGFSYPKEIKRDWN